MPVPNCVFRFRLPVSQESNNAIHAAERRQFANVVCAATASLRKLPCLYKSVMLW